MEKDAPFDYYGKILKQFDWNLRKAQNYITYPNPKETTKMISEKDCRRCERYDEEGRCKGNFKSDTELGCDDFTPISGRDCRNCNKFEGHRIECSDQSHLASTPLSSPCSDFTPIQTTKPKLKPSPTILTYTDEEDSKFRVTKGDKTLSLENIWASKPCGDEYRKMNIAFTGKGYDLNDDIPFTEGNLTILSDIAFAWLLDEGFFIKAEEERPIYEVGQWFKGDSDASYLLCNIDSPPRVMLLCVGGTYKQARQCRPGIWNTIEEASKAIGHTCWQSLEPIDSPLKD